MLPCDAAVCEGKQEASELKLAFIFCPAWTPHCIYFLRPPEIWQLYLGLLCFFRSWSTCDSLQTADSLLLSLECLRLKCQVHFSKWMVGNEAGRGVKSHSPRIATFGIFLSFSLVFINLCICLYSISSRSVCFINCSQGKPKHANYLFAFRRKSENCHVWTVPNWTRLSYLSFLMAVPLRLSCFQMLLLPREAQSSWHPAQWVDCFSLLQSCRKVLRCHMFILNAFLCFYAFNFGQLLP